ncbi:MULTISPECIES: cytochrome (ubi)quinol oxidase subunit III [Thermoactinomyces]|jgi:cytochrome c oxidase subunit III|uniref:Cytochrome (Ubi)quinol oxidase subunit III n=1 Tax=Thermoactinomyces vulgaris TaxID=2026 RepID=A0ABS0QK68_THEVU|nr:MULTISPECIES: cytochrome (ubi)quinol oxidase subunit III [Thermoactinomyces]KFZ40135.1 cytochrome B oxidoreductase [Thermoactinomyces sp. Gus2-1]KYQ85649.1 cytochrome B oxidoreductase [Thermoactinomyces sp. AS95]MBA4552519.1 cytochrome (ubi)quinol oxidase subunit III [Thermoactinomyces vulgaris]MBA4597689.1 cytochrome (ubi)quinol oxidase subunit III [Thermoactinomyces vulgaris]MBH8584539.1 cytochrome (ubi)quinol oxidase subunit III [Thermoactinomyces sp. CICC 10735]
MAAQTEAAQKPQHLETATLEGKNKVLGFWLFLGAETVLFACLFGSYLALRSQNMGGPDSTELFDLELVAVTTAILLTSSLTSVLAMVKMNQRHLKGTLVWLGITVLLGLAFLVLEIYEFIHYVSLGHTFMSSAFGSAFYALVGTHGAHVTFGLFWISGLMIQAAKRGITKETAPKLFLSSLYWHFIDVVWVFIFTLVYLLGKVG